MHSDKNDLHIIMLKRFEELHTALPSLSPLDKEMFMFFVVSLNKELEERAFQEGMDTYEKRHQEQQSTRLLEMLKKKVLPNTAKEKERAKEDGICL